ncbi:hypothetical protein CTI12_AA003990 [Artemisia annua]|uniref:Uncharacterized protein n=1 Tax=Artemisia annua TaxID=35608 RepID=A0A2U1QP37_ARTAN|nr:hypothetical protein CTI12_AA003990 [Artemisia annua]
MEELKYDDSGLYNESVGFKIKSSNLLKSLVLNDERLSLLLLTQTNKEDKPKVGIALETGKSYNTLNVERNIELSKDLENPRKYGCTIMASGSNNKSLNHVLKK